MKRIALLFVLVICLLLAVSATTLAQASPRSYLISANSNQLPAGLAAKVQAAGGTLTERMDNVGLAVATSSSPQFAAKLEKTAGIRSVVPNLSLQWIDPEAKVVAGVDVANPPFSGDNDTRFDLQWGHDAVDAPEAWAAGARGDGVRVAVLDTGFDLDHPDLAPNINFALSADMTGQGLGYALPDAFSHGTHVAGTIAAADNAFGTIGVAPEAELVLVKVLREDRDVALKYRAHQSLQKMTGRTDIPARADSWEEAFRQAAATGQPLQREPSPLVKLVNWWSE